MLQLSCEINTLPKFAGSSTFTYNESIVICTISHIQDFHTNQIEINFHDSLSPYKKQLEKYYSLVLQDIYKTVSLDQNKLIKYEINLYLVNGHENKLLCAANAMILALINAGYPLQEMCYACSTFSDLEEFCVVNKQDKILYAHKFNGTNDYKKNCAIIKDEIDFCIEKGLNADIFE